MNMYYKRFLQFLSLLSTTAVVLNSSKNLMLSFVEPNFAVIARRRHLQGPSTSDDLPRCQGCKNKNRSIEAYYMPISILFHRWLHTPQ